MASNAMTRPFHQFFLHRFHRAHHDLESKTPTSPPTMNVTFRHDPVLAAEIVSFLRPVSGMTILDGTLGGGGHSRLLLSAGACVIGSDRDPEALAHSRSELASYGEHFTAVERNFSEVSEALARIGVTQLDGILLACRLISSIRPPVDFLFRGKGRLTCAWEILGRQLPIW